MSSAVCPEKSKIKMAILTKAGHPNYTWYSYLKLNEKPENIIIDGMVNRFKRSKLVNITQCLMIYNNQTKELIQKIEK